MPRILGMRERTGWEFFDSYVVDGRQHRRTTGCTVRLSSGSLLRFFHEPSADPLLSNMRVAGQLPSDNTFQLKRLRLHAAFSDQQLAQEFFGSGVMTCIVGDKPYVEVPVYVFATRAGDEETGELIEQYPGGYVGTLELDKPVFIPARQLFRVEIQLSDWLARALEDLPGLGGYALISVGMGGLLTRDIL